MNISLDHLNLTVKNFDESELWYRKVFGFKVVEKGLDGGSPWGILRKDDTMLCIYEDPDRKTPGTLEEEHRIYHFGLRMQDPKAWEQTVEEQNLRLYYGGKVEYPHSSSWYVKDPSGHMIEVVHWHSQIQF